MTIYNLIVMRFRLFKEGHGSLKEYLRRRFVLAHLAKEIGITNQSLHPILNGKRLRPKPGHLEAIAEKAGLILGHDAQGAYFDEVLTKEEQDSDREEIKLTPSLLAICEKIMDMNEEDRVQWQNTIKFLLGIKD